MNKITETRLPAGHFSLYRETDKSGDSGMFWQCYDGKIALEERKYEWIKDSSGLVKIGYGIRVGSHYARSFHGQDWWQCSPVTEILSVSEDRKEVKFRTRSSIYIAKSI